MERTRRRAAPQSNRIGVNLLWLVPGVVGGSEEYTTRLLAGLAERQTDLDVTLFVLKQFASAHPAVAASYPTVTLPIEGSIKTARVAAEASWLASEVGRSGIELMHHAGGIMPAYRSTPGVVTIHDLQPLVIPQHFSRVKRNFLRLAIPRSVRAARLVLTPSGHTRQSVIDTLDADPERVLVVPSGIEPEPDDFDVDARALERAEIMARYKIGGPFFLYPAITYPHKNHTFLVRAFARVARERPEAHLVLTGGQAQMETEVRAEAVAQGVSDRVIRPGRIPRHDLDVLYRHATALTFPSLFEGFGVPALEAMNRSCPVIAADVTSLPEVVGDAGILLSPRDVPAWADAMISMLDKPELRAACAEAGKRRATTFSWTRSSGLLEVALWRGLELARQGAGADAGGRG